MKEKNKRKLKKQLDEMHALQTCADMHRVLNTPINDLIPKPTAIWEKVDGKVKIKQLTAFGYVEVKPDSYEEDK